VIDDLASQLRPHYSRFLSRTGEVLMTGHSHQAWPDVSRDGHLEAWDDAALLADKKWGRIFSEILPQYRACLASRIGARSPSAIAVAPNTHELLLRFLSCFPDRSRVMTTDREFHSMRRQLARLEEDGHPIVWIPREYDFVEALEREKPPVAMLSHVFFATSEIVDLMPILTSAARLGIPLLIDAYHAFNVLEMDIASWPGEVFVISGGYKYAEHGEGACWMHVPLFADRFRPRNTGWFADFAGLERTQGEIGYASGGDRFLGSTFDPTAFYRGLRVMEWMDRQGLSTAVLRAHSMAQTARLIERYDALDLASRGVGLASPRDPARRAGFVAFEHDDASGLVGRLEARGVRADARARWLRFGPAPYTTSMEIDRAMDALAASL